MKYYSEKLKSLFDSIKELEAAEKEFDKKELELRKIKEAKAARAKEIDEAYEEIQKSTRKYNELVNDFIKDYHEYHTTFKAPLVQIRSIKDLFDSWF